VHNVKELIALAKEKPNELNYGTFGIGSSGHLNMELFQALSGNSKRSTTRAQPRR
jgi:tripartite-type tricarboxylate transporter receptor subunit TctC